MHHYEPGILYMWKTVKIMTFCMMIFKIAAKMAEKNKINLHISRTIWHDTMILVSIYTILEMEFSWYERL